MTNMRYVYITILQYISQYITTYYNILQEHGLLQHASEMNLQNSLACLIPWCYKNALSIVLELRSRWKYWSLFQYAGVERCSDELLVFGGGGWILKLLMTKSCLLPNGDTISDLTKQQKVLNFPNNTVFTNYKKSKK